MTAKYTFDREKFVSLVAALICSDNHLDVQYIGKRNGDSHSAAVDRVAAIVDGILDAVPVEEERN